MQTIFWTTPALSNARCHCAEYYKYPQISPKHHTWLEIQNSITIFRGYLFGFSKFWSTFYIFTCCFACIASSIVSFTHYLINHCCFGTSTLSPWAKTTFLHMYFLQYVMEDEHKPSHNNPEEAANYVKAVNLLLQSFVNDIHGFDHYKHLRAWETFLHTLSQLLSKLDSAYFTNMDTEVVLDTIPDKTCAAFLAHPEEAANKVQQRVSSDSIPTGPEVTSKMCYKKTYHVLIKKNNKPSPDYLATFKTHTTTCQK